MRWCAVGLVTLVAVFDIYDRLRLRCDISDLQLQVQQQQRLVRLVRSDVESGIRLAFPSKQVKIPLRDDMVRGRGALTEH